MPLKLSYISQTSVPVEIEGFTPEWAGDKSLTEIERFEIFHGNRKIPLAEMFRVSGDAGDQQFEFEGELSGVHWIGAGMTRGRIHVSGSAGRHVGSGMRGGEIVIEGDTKAWTGAEMHGGVIHVCGSAGHQLGAAYRGSLKGMTGGTILVDGSAGNEVGLTMRRGLIAIAGSVGDMAGGNMIAGTVLAFGECGMRPGAGMRRGTIGLLGTNSPSLLPTFKYSCRQRTPMIPFLLREVRAKGLKFDESLLTESFDFYRGDFVALGKGEVVSRVGSSRE